MISCRSMLTIWQPLSFKVCCLSISLPLILILGGCNLFYQGAPVPADTGTWIGKPELIELLDEKNAPVRVLRFHVISGTSITSNAGNGDPILVDRKWRPIATDEWASKVALQVEGHRLHVTVNDPKYDPEKNTAELRLPGSTDRLHELPVLEVRHISAVREN